VSSTLDVTPATLADLAETRRLVEDAGVRWHQEQLDQRDLKAVRSAVDGAIALFGEIDILFANAGIHCFCSILEMQDADWHDQIDVNLTGSCTCFGR
jgi:NAD(P)-dependent dehydrogenase (short-subunit alcohol dehydrogenase family)